MFSLENRFYRLKAIISFMSCKLSKVEAVHCEGCNTSEDDKALTFGMAVLDQDSKVTMISTTM